MSRFHTYPRHVHTHPLCGGELCRVAPFPGAGTGAGMCPCLVFTLTHVLFHTHPLCCGELFSVAPFPGAGTSAGVHTRLVFTLTHYAEVYCVRVRACVDLGSDLMLLTPPKHTK